MHDVPVPRKLKSPSILRSVQTPRSPTGGPHSLTSCGVVGPILWTCSRHSPTLWMQNIAMGADPSAIAMAALAAPWRNHAETCLRVEGGGRSPSSGLCWLAILHNEIPYHRQGTKLYDVDKSKPNMAATIFCLETATQQIKVIHPACGNLPVAS